MKNRKVKLAMIGGGTGSFIGAIHRIAANLDGQIELVAGAFSSRAEVSKETGASLFLDPSRVYESYDALFEGELKLPEGNRADLISIVTPNHVHFEPAKRALKSGFHVALDKPMTRTLDEAKALATIAKDAKGYFLLTHTYIGYPMVKEARARIAAGEIGRVRKVFVEYPQGWLSEPLEETGNKQASWRTDPSKSGAAGAMGDIGTHAFNLAEYVTGLDVVELCCELNRVVEGRALDDDGAVLLRFDNGASGTLVATQVAAGAENNIKICVYGEKGGLQWQQEDNNSLVMRWLDKPAQILRAGTPYVTEAAAHNSRTPAGHPEGYLEAFANHYRNLAHCIQASWRGVAPSKQDLDFPGIRDGLRGMAFIETVVRANDAPEKWISLNI